MMYVPFIVDLMLMSAWTGVIPDSAMKRSALIWPVMYSVVRMEEARSVKGNICQSLAGWSRLASLLFIADFIENSHYVPHVLSIR